MPLVDAEGPLTGVPEGAGDPSRRALDERVRAWMAEPDPWASAPDDARFGALALELFAYQFEHCAPYRRLCERRDRTPGQVDRWQDIPAVPAGAFKELRIACFDPSATRHVFRTSGTSTAHRGALHLDTLALYEASLVPSFERFLLPELAGRPGRARIVVLAPSANTAPDSSLSHMFQVMVERRGDGASGFFMGGDALDVDGVLAALAEPCGEGVPTLVCGTAFAFVHLLDALGREGGAIRLPEGARVMETGGFKGRSRELARDALHHEIADGLGVPATRIVNQYGMTELGSQFYDTRLNQPESPCRKLGPPWTRVLLVDPDLGTPVADGEPGAIRIFDLANTGSVACLQTADLGRRAGDGFEVLGRAPGAEERGCSIAVDEMLGG